MVSFQQTDDLSASAKITYQIWRKAPSEVGEQSKKVKIRLLDNPYSCEGHSIKNNLSKGQSLRVELSVDDPAQIQPNTEIKLKREIYNGMGPDGLVESDAWSVLEIIR